MVFLHDDFLLRSETARRLYHETAAGLPIYDYHCHLPPADIASNRRFENLHEIWLEGDHYKWRAMRASGIDEVHITGNADPYEKFLAWARTVPKTMRNPLYQWTHLELRRYFGIELLLNADTAREIWDETERQLKSLDTHAILDRFQVAVVCTTDDPADSLDHHETISGLAIDTKVYPAYRPDRVFDTHDLDAWKSYLERLGQMAGSECRQLDTLLAALAKRHADFADAGGRLSDHSFAYLPDVDFDDNDVASIFDQAFQGQTLDPGQQDRLAMYLLHHMAQLDAERGWTKQLHLGAYRNLNSRMFQTLGRDVGCDSIGDFSQAAGLARFLDRLDRQGRLPQTILYNVNPTDNYLLATMIGNYQCGPTAGKLQWGSGWWHLDQKDGMRWQMDALSNLGLLSQFVGMLTDSRSLMSYPRHEYFRRILCDLVGTDAEAGELPDDWDLLSRLVGDICFHNADRYFGLKLSPRYCAD